MISVHIDLLLKIKKVWDANNLLNRCRKLRQKLKTLKLETCSYGCLLIPILRETLSGHLKLLTSRKLGGNVWTLDTLLKSILDELLGS